MKSLHQAPAEDVFLKKKKKKKKKKLKKCCTNPIFSYPSSLIEEDILGTPEARETPTQNKETMQLELRLTDFCTFVEVLL
jgi:hypothetical protein